MNPEGIELIPYEWKPQTEKRMQRLLEEFEYFCFYCGDGIYPHKNTDTRKLHSVDHYIPLSRGGSLTFDNLVLACRQCNSEKSDMLPDQFISLFVLESAERETFIKSYHRAKSLTAEKQRQGKRT